MSGLTGLAPAIVTTGGIDTPLGAITLSTVGIWTILASLIGVLIRTWPVIQLQVIKAKETLRAERRDELATMAERLGQIEHEARAAFERTHRVEMQLMAAMSAYRLIANELQRHDPHSAALIQAQILLNQAWAPPSGEPPDMADMVGRMGAS